MIRAVSAPVPTQSARLKGGNRGFGALASHGGQAYYIAIAIYQTHVLARVAEMSAATGISKLLRTQIRKRHLSQYRIAKDTGIKQPCLSRFLKGGSLKMETAGVLLDYLGFEVCEKTRAQRTRAS